MCPIVLTLSHSCHTGSKKRFETKADSLNFIHDSLIGAIRQMEDTMAKAAFSSNDEVVKNVLRTTQNFVNFFPADSLCPEFLVLGAKVAEANGQFEKAIQLLLKYHDSYPNAINRDFIAYRVAFIYDEHLKDKEKAKAYYNKVIQLYPGTKWASEAEAALRLVDMSDEELIKFLQEKNKPA
jgi:tetratricopeptide (TPR) repeat protein